MKNLRNGIILLSMFAGAPAAFAQCPLGLPHGTTCHAGRDTNGAFFLIAVPSNYNRNLVIWTHGYGSNPPAQLGAGDLGFGNLLLPAGFAVAASSYRPDAAGLSGWQVADAALDTESLRPRFVQIVGKPDMTFVTGVSMGGLIAEEISERFGADEDGHRVYNGAMPMCGPVAGGAENWNLALDLRVVYQHYCQNLPRANEVQYPLYLGLQPGGTLTLPEVTNRINECTGILTPPALRSTQQRANLANILNVTTIPESFLLTDMFFGTFGLAELTQVRTHGLSPLTNFEVQYKGSTNDRELNATVFRTRANEDAREILARAYNPTGSFAMPMLTMHTIGDGLVFVENENAFLEKVAERGRTHQVFQTYTNASGHCQFSGSEFLAGFQALTQWAHTEQRPTQSEVAALCTGFSANLHDTCNFNPTFRPGEIDGRIPNRSPEFSRERK